MRVFLVLVLGLGSQQISQFHSATGRNFLRAGRFDSDGLCRHGCDRKKAEGNQYASVSIRAPRRNERGANTPC